MYLSGGRAGRGGQRLTRVHVAAVVAAESAPASAAAAHVAASSPAPHVGRRRHLVVHGAAHAETRVVLLRGERELLSGARFPHPVARPPAGNNALREGVLEPEEAAEGASPKTRPRLPPKCGS